MGRLFIPALSTAFVLHSGIPIIIIIIVVLQHWPRRVSSQKYYFSFFFLLPGFCKLAPFHPSHSFVCLPIHARKKSSLLLLLLFNSFSTWLWGRKKGRREETQSPWNVCPEFCTDDAASQEDSCHWRLKHVGAAACGLLQLYYVCILLHRMEEGATFLSISSPFMGQICLFSLPIGHAVAAC